MLDPEFAAALKQYGYELPAETGQQIEAYARLLWQWNEQLNLTRHSTWDKFVGRDLRDCLQVAPLLASGEDVLDLGSGNGIPGIPLAILRPDLNVSLAESVANAPRYSMRSWPTCHCRSRFTKPGARTCSTTFGSRRLSARAVGSLLKLCQWVEPHWASIDRMLAIKGPKWIAERGEARHHGVLNGLQLRVAASYPLGEGDSEGVILQIWPKGSEPG